MADGTAIEWTDDSWNPIRARGVAGKVGWHCEHVSEGCRNCYAEGINRRLGNGLEYKPGHRAALEIFIDEKTLLAPLKRKNPRMIFVCSMSDLFADFVMDEQIDRMFAVMALCPQHRFQILTKRAKRMREYVSQFRRERHYVVGDRITSHDPRDGNKFLLLQEGQDWPLPNVWKGISAEDQANADERIPDLLATPAAVRFVSLEPLLGAIDLEAMPFPDGDQRHRWSALTGQALMYGSGVNGNPDMTIRIDKPIRSKLDWVIVGSESGPHARPCDLDWVRSIRDQCQASDVPFFWKQHAERGRKISTPELDGRRWVGMPA